VTGEVESGRPQFSAVSRAIAFPGYRRDPGSGFLLYDAALLVLATPTSTPAVRLAGPAQARRLRLGERAEIVGWTGSVRAQGRPAARVAAPTAIQPPTRCAGTERREVPDPARQLCTADPPSFRTGVCSGDSGGPLLVGTGAEALEVGVASGAFAAAGTHACLTTAGDVWTPAAAISAWARRWIAVYSPAARRRALSARRAAGAPHPGRRPS
jgi:secreted trypsin-like serine protease